MLGSAIHARRASSLDTSTADVIVFKEGDYAVAVDGKTKEVIARSTDHAQVIQKAIDIGGRIIISGNFTLNNPVVVDKAIERLELIQVNGKIIFYGTGHAIQLSTVNYFQGEGLHIEGTDGSTSPQGALKIGSGVRAFVKRCIFDKLLPDIDTSTFQILHFDNFNVIIVEENIVRASSNVGSVNGFDNLTLSPDAEDSVVIVRKNRIENFGDAVAMWGGLCIAEENTIINSPLDNPWGIDFARCKIGIAKKNYIRAAKLGRAIFAHLASGEITPKMFVVEDNRIESEQTSNSSYGLIDICCGEEVYVEKNVIHNPYRGIWIHAATAMKHVVVHDNMLYNPAFLSIVVHAESADIESAHVEDNVIYNPSGHSVFYLRSGTGTLKYVEARGNRVPNPGTLEVGIWNIEASKKKILDNEPGINGDGVVQVVSDCTNIPSNGDYVGQLIACCDSGAGRWVLKVWNGSAWQSIG